jgi:hypothetical protein
MGGLLVGQWLLRETTLDAIAERAPWYAFASLAALMAGAIILAPDDNRAFLYFQF